MAKAATDDFIKKFEMNEINTKILLQRLKDSFDVIDDSTLKVVQKSYIVWFANKFEMNEINVGILKTRYEDIFFEDKAGAVQIFLSGDSDPITLFDH